MCGLIGFFAAPGSVLRPDDVAVSMKRMVPRGPDAGGMWQDDGVILGHRRLAILDLDPRANQPLLSPCGRYVIAYNGEVYNFRDLRRELEAGGAAFQTTSDTEVLLALFASEGEAMLSRLRGMFAFVIWDRIEQRGFAARDPYGIKPLYYASTQDGVLVASQVKALLATGRISRAPDARGQAGFWLMGSVPEPHTWYRDIRALPAGHCAWIDKGRVGAPRCWWDIGAVWRNAPAAQLPDDEVRVRVADALRASVTAHMVSDVPVGVFLSGGIDSGALAGLMHAGVKNLQGITIAFSEFAGKHEDEVPSAASIAARYGIAHHVRHVTQNEFEADLPRILDAMDQPSIDGINTWYASKAVAERGLKVVVSGVGGDELFQGYSSFRQLPALVSAWSPLSSLPLAMTLARAIFGLRARRTGVVRWRHFPEWSRSISGAWWLRRGLFSPIELPALMGDELALEGLRGFEPEAWVQEMSGPLALDSRMAVGQMESTGYLRNQLLRDSDWASMDHSVELRTPLVDAWLLRDLQPALASFRTFPGKRLLAEAPAIALPREIVERRKTGFGIPLGRWLRGSPGSASVDSQGWSRRLVSAYAGQASL